MSSSPMQKRRPLNLSWINKVLRTLSNRKVFFSLIILVGGIVFVATTKYEVKFLFEVRRKPSKWTSTTTIAQDTQERASASPQLPKSLSVILSPEETNRNLIIGGRSYSLELLDDETWKSKDPKDEHSILLEAALPLPQPILVLGMPKAGTKSIANFFHRANYTAGHWKRPHPNNTKEEQYLGLCLEEAYQLSLPGLKTCGEFQVWTQLDVALPPNKCSFPQITLLDEIHQEAPNATYILNRRELHHWMESVQAWTQLFDGAGRPIKKSGMDIRLARCQKKGGPISAEPADIIQWHKDQVQRVRRFVAEHSSHALLEIDIEDSIHTPIRMAKTFHINPKYWQHVNKNSQKIGSIAAPNKQTASPPNKQNGQYSLAKTTNGSTSIKTDKTKQTSTVSSKLKKKEMLLELSPDYVNENVVIGGLPYSLDLLDDSTWKTKPEHAKDREAQFLESVLPLPQPYIVVGMPKAGTTSLTRFFEKANYRTGHYQENIRGVGNNVFLGLCIEKNYKSGSPGLKNCGNFQAWTQMDIALTKKQCVFPQITYLEEIHAEAPNATFILNRRDFQNWYQSLSNWQWKHDSAGNVEPYNVRLWQCHYRGGPSSPNATEVIQWHKEQVQRIRKFVFDHPSHALLEVNIEDGSKTPNDLAKAFHVDASNWVQANKNANNGM